MHIYNIIALDAWRMMEIDKDFALIDVRTAREWEQIGKPNIPGKDVVFLSFLITSEMLPNHNFIDDLKMYAPSQNTKLIFICKSGGRSAKAAENAAKFGYICYNIIDGFEGSSEGEGWKNSNLPCV